MTSQRIFNMKNIAKNIIFIVSGSYLWHLRSTRMKPWATIYVTYVHRLHGGPLFSVLLCIEAWRYLVKKECSVCDRNSTLKNASTQYVRGMTWGMMTRAERRTLAATGQTKEDSVTDRRSYRNVFGKDQSTLYVEQFRVDATDDWTAVTRCDAAADTGRWPAWRHWWRRRWRRRPRRRRHDSVTWRRRQRKWTWVEVLLVDAIAAVPNRYQPIVCMQHLHK